MPPRTRIFVIATDSAGCYHYRLHLPLTHLNPDEWEVIWRPPDPAEMIEGDVVIGQRLHGHNQAWLDMCANPAVTCAYEIDDDILDVDPANTIPHQIFAPAREGTLANITAADLVTASTPHLAAKLDRYNAQVVMLPNYADPAWLDLPDTRHRDGTVAVGWAGSPFHGQDWGGVNEALTTVAGRQSRARFADHGGGHLHVPGHPVRRRGFTPVGDHMAHLNFDIGIAPLAHTDFNASKSWVKLLEYGCRGIPAVAARWGQYPQWVGWSTATPGLLYDDPAALAACIEVLFEDDIRAKMGEAARARAATLTIDKHAHRWADAYRAAVEANQ